MRWLTRFLGIEVLVERAVDAKIEQVQRVSAAILGQEFIPKVIECDKGRHYFEEWEQLKGEGLMWTQKDKEGKPYVVKRHLPYTRKCKACGLRQARVMKIDYDQPGEQ